MMIGIVLVMLLSLSVLGLCLSCCVCGRCRLSAAWLPASARIGPDEDLGVAH